MCKTLYSNDIRHTWVFGMIFAMYMCIEHVYQGYTPGLNTGTQRDNVMWESTTSVLLGTDLYMWIHRLKHVHKGKPSSTASRITGMGSSVHLEKLRRNMKRKIKVIMLVTSCPLSHSGVKNLKVCKRCRWFNGEHGEYIECGEN